MASGIFTRKLAYKAVSKRRKNVKNLSSQFIKP